ncbi:hypothetical protein [uncultured Thiodictyon sp.]|uniref:hypothetical protein n=1 Tax=uncultured Thiodictyon sp. TaxID=1846217 RepID=UPI0025F3D617|nr:hypothetical protein [uncultured Thiodictyon sp.]
MVIQHWRLSYPVVFALILELGLIDRALAGGGTWDGTTSQSKPVFFVIENNALTSFEGTASVSSGGCTATVTSTVLLSPSLPIQNNQVNYTNSSGSSFTAQFSSAAAASGTFSTYVNSSGCYIGTVSVTWQATLSSPTPTYFVTPSGGSVRSAGTVSPNSSQKVIAGAVGAFTVTANSGYARDSAVGGTCPAGSWSGNVWTTGAITANCTVSFSFTQLPDDQGNTKETATLVAPNSSTTGSINPVADLDYFRVDLTEGGLLTVKSTAATFHTNGYLLDGAGNVLVTDENIMDGYNFFIARTLSAGTYYVRLSSWGSFSTNTYTLVSTFSPVNYTVTPSAGSGGSVSPNSPQPVNAGASSAFTVTADGGYTRDNTVSGTCPTGSWSADIWTTGAITGDCTVSFNFKEQFCWECLPSSGGWRGVIQ